MGRMLRNQPYSRLTCWVGGCSLESDGEGEAVGDGRQEMVTGGSGRIWAVRAADSRATSAIFECQRVGYRLGRVGRRVASVNLTGVTGSFGFLAETVFMRCKWY